jgi:hypothetical protein
VCRASIGATPHSRLAGARVRDLSPSGLVGYREIALR